MIQPLKISGGKIVTDGVINYLLPETCEVMAYIISGFSRPLVFGWTSCKYISPPSIAIIFKKGKRPDLPYPQKR